MPKGEGAVLPLCCSVGLFGFWVCRAVPCRVVWVSRRTFRVLASSCPLVVKKMLCIVRCVLRSTVVILSFACVVVLSCLFCVFVSVSTCLSCMRLPLFRCLDEFTVKHKEVSNFHVSILSFLIPNPCPLGLSTLSVLPVTPRERTDTWNYRPAAIRQD